jgi:prepilin-type N-terminal cleavage/methylation domain-containing protein
VRGSVVAAGTHEMCLQRNRTAKTTALLSAAGFSLVEMIMVTGIISVMMVTASMVLPGLLSQSKADAGTAQVLNTLRLARDRAIGDRRNVELIFTLPRHLQLVRKGIGGAADLTLADIDLENNQEFLHFASTLDIGEPFGLVNEPVAFGPTQDEIIQTMFTSEGTFVDGTGDPTNGTIFLGNKNDVMSARAISIFGVTALLRPWRWDGAKWVEG